MGYTKLPPSSGGSGAVDSVFGRTGVVAAASGDYAAAQVTNTPAGGIAAVTVQTAINELDSEKLDALQGPTNAIVRTDSSGIIIADNAYQFDPSTKGLSVSNTIQPNNDGGGTLDGQTVYIDPLQNSSNDLWSIKNLVVNYDPNSTGFNLGTSGTAIGTDGISVNHLGTGDLGSINFSVKSFNLGNGVDPINVNGFAYHSGQGQVNANATINGQITGYSFQPGFNAASALTSGIQAFTDSAQMPIAVPGYQGFISGPTISSISNTFNYSGLSVNPTITTFTGNSGFGGVGIFSTLGTFTTGNFQGLAISPTITDMGTGSFFGINMAPNITVAKNATGLNISMSAVTPYAGVKSSLTIQDLFLEFLAPGDNNSITVEYVNDGTAGSETANLAGNALTVHIQSGVSTATQVKAALDASPIIFSNITTTITGVAGNAQVTQAPTNFIGGENVGNIKAAQFDGDVSISGDLSFSGALSIGKLSAFATQAVVDAGGSPSTIHSLVSSPTVGNGLTIANADTIGVNTAALINIGTGSTVTSGAFGLGLSSLALPAVVTVGAGSTVDIINGGTFALSMGGGTGTITKATGSRSVFIGDGTTSVTRFIAYYAQYLGVGATENWGIHAATPEYNFMQSLKIDGTEGSTDKVTNSSVGLEIGGTAKALRLSNMTTAQKNLLTALAGMMVFDTDLTKVCYYDGTVWVAV